MLTKSDLSAIQKVVDSSIQKEVNPLKGDFKTLQTGMDSMQGNVKTLQTGMDSLRTDATSLKKDVKNIKSSVRRLNKTADVIIDHFDRNQVRLRKRVDKIENHIELTSSSI